MAKNFSQIIAAVQDWLNIEDPSARLNNTVCGDIINIVMRDYCRRRESKYGETSDNFATVALTRDYTLADSFSKPKKIWYVNPDTGAAVFPEYLDKDVFDSKFPGSVVYSSGGPYTVAGVDTSLIVGDPTAYTIWNGLLMLAKVPNRVLTIFRDYYQIPADLVVGSNETNRFTNQAWEYLLFASLVKATEYGIEDERLPVWMAEMQRFETALDSEDSRRSQTARASQGREPG